MAAKVLPGSAKSQRIHSRINTNRPPLRNAGGRLEDSISVFLFSGGFAVLFEQPPDFQKAEALFLRDPPQILKFRLTALNTVAL